MTDDRWRADITTNPTRDFELRIEVYESDVCRAIIERDASGCLMLQVFAEAQIPAAWLAALIERAERELPRSA